MSRSVTLPSDIASRKKAEIAKYKVFLGDYVKRLEDLKASLGDHGGRKIDNLISTAKHAQGNVTASSFDLGYTAALKSTLDQSLEKLEKSFKQRENVANATKAYRASWESPNSLQKEHVYGATTRDTLNYFRTANATGFKPGLRNQSNVLGTPKGGVTSEMVDAVKNFDGEAVFNKPGYTTRKTLEYASKSASADIAREIARVDKLLDINRASGLTYDEEHRYDVQETSGNNSAFFGSTWDSMVGAMGRYARRISETSEAADSHRYNKFIKHKDDALQRLIRQLGVGGIATSIMDMIEKELGENDYLDSITFNKILEMIGEQKEKDEEGLWADIMDEMNDLNDRAIQKAEEHVENEDSRSMMRLLQVVLISSVLFGFPLLGPLIGEVAGAIFGQGIAHGAPALMTSEYLWVVGDFAEVIMLDEFATLILTEMPVVADLVGVVDYALLSGPGVILGDSAISLLASPLVPVGVAGAVFISSFGNQEYNSKKDSIIKSFKSLDDQLDDIVERYGSLGADNYKNAGGELKDDAKRKEFCENKYNLIKGGDKIDVMTGFINFLDDALQSGEVSNEILQILDDSSSKEFKEFLFENGLDKSGSVADWSRVKGAVAKAIHESDNSESQKKIAEELFEKFGLFSLACETSNGEKQDLIEKFAEYVGQKDPQDRKVNAQIGNIIYDSKYDLMRANSINLDFREDLLNTSLKGKDYQELRQFAKEISNESKRVRSEVIQKESDFIKESIAKRTINQDKVEGHNARVSDPDLSQVRPGFSPSKPIATSAQNIAHSAGLVQV